MTSSQYSIEKERLLCRYLNTKNPGPNIFKSSLTARDFQAFSMIIPLFVDYVIQTGLCHEDVICPLRKYRCVLDEWSALCIRHFDEKGLRWCVRYSRDRMWQALSKIRNLSDLSRDIRLTDCGFRAREQLYQAHLVLQSFRISEHDFGSRPSYVTYWANHVSYAQCSCSTQLLSRLPQHTYAEQMTAPQTNSSSC